MMGVAMGVRGRLPDPRPSLGPLERGIGFQLPLSAPPSLHLVPNPSVSLCPSLASSLAPAQAPSPSLCGVQCSLSPESLTPWGCLFLSLMVSVLVCHSVGLSQTGLRSLMVTVSALLGLSAAHTPCSFLLP